MEFLKKFFVKPTIEDWGNFYTFESIYSFNLNDYTIFNCSEGFMHLMRKSSIKCHIIKERKEVIVIRSEIGNGAIRIACDNKVLLEELKRLKEI